MWNKKSESICVHKGKKSLLEIQNCLKCSSPLFPWHLHADGLEDEGGRSLLRLIMVDYKKKDENDKSVSVYANVTPLDIKWLLWQLIWEKEEVEFAQHKIFEKEKGTGKGTVTNLKIQRWEYDNKGIMRDYPWYIQIQNGEGRIAHNTKGGQYCEKGTYKEKKQVDIYLTDRQMFDLLIPVHTVIRAFEYDAMYHRRDVDNMKKLLSRMENLLESSFGRVQNSRREGRKAA